MVSDDWRCSETGPVTDVHFWFSAQGDWLNLQNPIGAQIQNVRVTIYEDVPANAGESRQSPRAYSVATRFQRRTLSHDPEQEYFADEMTDNSSPTGRSALRLISRDSVMHYKQVRTPVRTVARELQVDAIVKGSIVRGATGADRGRMIRAVTGEIIWTQNFDGELRDLPALPMNADQPSAGTSISSRRRRRRARFASPRPVDRRTSNAARAGATPPRNRGKTEESDRILRRCHPAMLPTRCHAGLAEAYTELSGFYLDPREACKSQAGRRDGAASG